MIKMNKKNKVKEIVEVVKTITEDKTADVEKVVTEAIAKNKTTFISKLVKGVKFIITFLIKSGLWKKLGIAKYWERAGIILALVGTTYSTVNESTTTPQLFGELDNLRIYVDSLENSNVVLKEQLSGYNSVFEVVSLDTIPNLK